jgi:outer membrane autotransporter protein
MRKVVLGIVALLSAGGNVALSADMPLKAVRKAPPIGYSWTGCYIGGHVGGLTGQTEYTSDFANNASFTPNQDVNFSSFTGGGQVGCNYQTSSRIVLGLEVDVSAADVNKYGIIDQVEFEQILRTNIDWYGSVRGRIGYAADRWMIYATGGWAFSRITSSYENYTDASLTVLETSGAIPYDEGVHKSGWTVGAGLEYALTDNWIVRGEYLYFDFGKQRVFDPGPVYVDGRTDFHVGRFGLSYKFGAPAMARY